MRAVDDAQSVKRLISVVEAVRRGDHLRVNAEDAVELDAVAGLLEHLTPGGVFGVFARFQPTARESPCGTLTLGPVGEEHTTALIGDDGVRRDAEVHPVTLTSRREPMPRCPSLLGYESMLWGKARVGGAPIQDVVSSLIAIDAVTYVAETTGSFDVMFELTCSDDIELRQALDRIRQIPAISGVVGHLYFDLIYKPMIPRVGPR